MGNGTSGNLSINLHRNNSIYYTDELITGNICLNIDEGHLKGNEISVGLTGEIGFTKNERTLNVQGHSSAATIEYHHLPFYSKKRLLIEANPNEKEFVLSSGSYSWPFELALLTNLPPTLNDPHVYPHVRYSLQVILKTRWYRFDRKETMYVSIYPRVNLLANVNCLLPTRFANENRKDICLKGCINKSGYVANEIISIQLNIENPKKVLIKQIDLLLFQLYQISDNSSENLLFRTSLPNIVNRRDEQIDETSCVLLPSKVLPPTFHFQRENQKQIFVQISYFLRFEVKVEGLFTNFDIDVPIRIANQNDNENDPPPPSYESFMRNLTRFLNT